MSELVNTEVNSGNQTERVNHVYRIYRIENNINRDEAFSIPLAKIN